MKVSGAEVFVVRSNLFVVVFVFFYQRSNSSLHFFMSIETNVSTLFFIIINFTLYILVKERSRYFAVVAFINHEFIV